MRRTTAVVWVSALMAAGCSTTPSSAQTAAPPAVVAVEPARVTIWDGVFTAAQADRGEDLAQSNCFTCHGQREWANPGMLRLWSGQPLSGFYENIRSTMPYDSPGRLTRDEYADIVSYILQLNDAPTGAAELPSTDEGLAAIEVSAQ